MLNRLNILLPYGILVIFLIYFSQFFMGVNGFVYAVYSFTRVSTFIPYAVVAVVFSFLSMIGGFTVMAALKDVKRGTEWVVIFLLMSALPFILLGVPLGALNSIFICRSMLNLFVFVLFLKWFLRTTYLGRPAIRAPLLLPIFMLFMIYVANIMFVDAELRFSVFKMCMILVSCIMFFYLLVNIIRDKKTLTRFLEIMVIACIIQILLSSLNFIYYIFILHRMDYRLDGMLRDYELFAEYLALHIPLFIYFFRNPGAMVSRKVLKMFLILLIFALFATATRGAILSLVAGLFYYGWNMRRQISIGKIATQVLIWGLLAAAALFVLYHTFPPSAQIIERFTSSNITTLDTRDAIWHRSWQYIQEKPLTGHGIVYNLASNLFWPHSTLFYYLLTLGVPGLVAYITLILGLLLKAFHNERMVRQQGAMFEMTVAINTLLIMFVIDSTKIEYLRYPNYQLFVWLLFALVVSVNEMLVHKPEKNHENPAHQ